MTRAIAKGNRTNRTADIPLSDRPPFQALPSETESATKEQVARVLDALEVLWHQERAVIEEDHHLEDPLDGLILTVLSQNTNDRNRDRGFAGLKTRFLSWEDVARAALDDIADAIRPAGIANNKARTIKRVLEIIFSRFGSFSLMEMKDWAADEARNFLENLPGVGPKTAACVLVFDLDMPAFPADTHVTRVCKRLGWAPTSSTPARIQDLMERIVSPERYKGAHLNLIEHGRHLCKARNPLCPKCPVRSMCLFGFPDQEVPPHD